MEQVRPHDLEVVVTPVAPEASVAPVAPEPPVGPEVNAAVVALLERSREGLRTSAAELDARARWSGAHLAALRAAVPVVRRTDRDGTVRLHVDGPAMRVEEAR